MTDLDSLPMHHPGESAPTLNGAAGRKPCRRHQWGYVHVIDDRHVAHISGGGCLQCTRRLGILMPGCLRCLVLRDPAASRRGRTNRKRGNRAELDVARSIPGGRKMAGS